MKCKNKNHSMKRVISDRKFSRLFNNNLDNAGLCYVTKNWVTYRSLQAVKINNIIYAKFPTKEQTGNRLQTFCVRYKIEDEFAEDYVAFSIFPLKAF